MIQLFQERPVLGQERERGEENALHSTNEEEDSNIQTSNIARYESSIIVSFVHVLAIDFAAISNQISRGPFTALRANLVYRDINTYKI